MLLPGDPGRALAVAQALLDKPPRMFNHARGLWGYTGVAPDGEPLTVQATGMGGPSAAIVCEELIALGATRLVRIGTCGALDPELELGTLIAAESVLPADGTSAALGADEPLAPDPDLLERLVAAGARARPPWRAATSSTTRATPRPAGPSAARSPWRWRPPRSCGWPTAAGWRAACWVCAGGARRCLGSNGARRMSADELVELGVRVGEAGYAALRSP